MRACARTRSDLAAAEVVRCAGRPLTTPPRTLVDLAAALPLVPLVALGDAAARRSGLPELQAAVRAAAGRRGVPLARRALELVDPGAESPGETRCRLLLHGAGFPGLRHRVRVLDDDGQWLAAPDLADEQARVAVPYDGLVHLHRGPARWQADIDRDELARAAGWEVVVLTALDLRQPDRAVLKGAGGVPARRSRRPEGSRPTERRAAPE